MKFLLKILLVIALFIYIDQNILMLSPIMFFTVVIMAIPFYIVYKSCRFIHRKIAY